MNMGSVHTLQTFWYKTGSSSSQLIWNLNEARVTAESAVAVNTYAKSNEKCIRYVSILLASS